MNNRKLKRPTDNCGVTAVSTVTYICDACLMLHVQRATSVP